MDFVQKSTCNAINWVTKQRGYYPGADDIDIHIGKSNGRERMAMTIRNGVHEKFGSEYLVFGIDGDRLWFAESDATYGYKMTTAGKNNPNENRYVSVMDESLVSWAHNHIGAYRLDRDVKSGLCYVDARRIN